MPRKPLKSSSKRSLGKKTEKPSPNILEHDIQAAFFDWVDWKAQSDWRYKNIYANTNAGKRSFGALNYYRREGLRSGVPDVFIAWPNRYYPGCYLEFKTATGRLSKEQEGWGNRVSRAGYAWSVVRSYEEAKRTTEVYMAEQDEN